MEYQATAKYLHTSTRKLRLVADSIRKLTPTAALVQLEAMSKYAAGPLLKVLNSALANAKVRGASTETLRFKTIEVMGGPAMKRWQPVSRGMAHSYKKRMTHVRVILTESAVESGGVAVKEENHGTKN